MAAVTITLLNKNHHRVKYLCTCAGGAATANLDAAGAGTPDLITDTDPATPIRNLVSTAVASQAAARALMRTTGVTYRLGPGGTAGADWRIDFNTAGATTNLRVTVGAAGADAVGTVLEIESVHSQFR